MFSNDTSQQYIICNTATGQTQTFKNENELIFLLLAPLEKECGIILILMQISI